MAEEESNHPHDQVLRIVFARLNSPDKEDRKAGIQELIFILLATGLITLATARAYFP